MVVQQGQTQYAIIILLIDTSQIQSWGGGRDREKSVMVGCEVPLIFLPLQL